MSCRMATSCTSASVSKAPAATALAAAALVAALASPAGANPHDGPRLLEQAKAAKPERYQLAVRHHAQFIPMPDHRSFAVLWYPSDHPTTKPPMIVSLHGHGSWATDEFAMWFPYLEQRGYGFLAVQWWFGSGEDTSDYYTPQELYPQIEKLLSEEDVAPGTVLLHGFSRGASNVYALTALDRTQGSRFFLMALANSGGASENYRPNDKITRGGFGATPFAGTDWAFFCGGRDPHPDRDGCPAMDRSRRWVEYLGGATVLFLDDQQADHGGFHRTPAHVEQVLDLFAHVLKQGAREP